MGRDGKFSAKSTAWEENRGILWQEGQRHQNAPVIGLMAEPKLLLKLLEVG
jgi:hypothetical protein